MASSCPLFAGFVELRSLGAATAGSVTCRRVRLGSGFLGPWVSRFFLSPSREGCNRFRAGTFGRWTLGLLGVELAANLANDPLPVRRRIITAFSSISLSFGTIASAEVIGYISVV